MKSQTMRVSIPAPPIPEPSATAAAPEVAESPSPVVASADDLPPEPAVSDDREEAKTTGGSKTPSPKPSETTKKSGPTLTRLREEAHQLAGRKLSYVFGADNPDTGGLDCSSTIQLLLTKIGVKDVPRTSYDQYYWLKRKKLLDDVYGKGSSSKLLKKLSPGDLIFWGGTWKSGHRVSHVMLYMGYDPSRDKHYVFGARSKNSTGLTGSGVDIFELNTESGRLVAHGKIPGLIYE